MTGQDDCKSRLASEIGKIEIYSSHEHFCPESELLKKPMDFSSLFGYLKYTLTAVGMPPEDLVKLVV